MTEAEWLECSKATTRVMGWLRHKGSSRQFYLAGCAAVRHVWQALPEKRYRDLIDLVERHADGLASQRELARAHAAAEGEVIDRCQELQAQGRSLSHASKVLAAQFAAARAAMPGGYEAGYSAMVDALRVGKRADQWAWQCAMLRDIFGNPFRPVSIDPAWLSWHHGTNRRLAQTIYDARRLEDLPILADALEEAGCTSSDILEHCRGPGPHCWGKREGHD